MTDRREQPVPSAAGIRSAWLSRWRGALLAVAALLCASTVAQVADPAPPQTYCYSRIGAGPFCSPTLGQAEAVMRADPFFEGAGDVVEHFNTALIPSSTLWLQYAARDRPALSVGTEAYWGEFGIYGNSQGQCPPSDDQTALPGWCSNEGALNALARQKIAAAYPACDLGANVLLGEYDNDTPALAGELNTTRGLVDYSRRWFKVDIDCPGTIVYTKAWFVLKKRPLYCRAGFNVINGSDVPATTLAQDNHCEADVGDVVRIATPFQQCGGCAGSPNPIYPATGEKRRAETDFEFAGEVFTRHYRSLRQYRAGRAFAVGWSHTWADRVLSAGQTSIKIIVRPGTNRIITAYPF